MTFTYRMIEVATALFIVITAWLIYQDPFVSQQKHAPKQHEALSQSAKAPSSAQLQASDLFNQIMKQLKQKGLPVSSLTSEAHSPTHIQLTVLPTTPNLKENQKQDIEAVIHDVAESNGFNPDTFQVKMTAKGSSSRN
ncbi:hypothetical protein GCM10011391_24620 [Pullulanibacillus camelliae]|uniref:Uncharacterized protein n=1 Tax=Pullulanibacillus camelliae TaxID=1707096 RepID=A0A8J3DTV4_9BACL|nr:hypothetical protein [Pullulanibacillus camelliae]GGE44855.1 hypothetical protein GCM10011391_24620 [Pullulanibacillus camelliae]